MTKKRATTIITLFSIYQIAGGVFGIFLNLYLLFFQFQLNIFFLFYSLLGIALFTFCTYAGIKCFKDASFGLTLTFYNQLIQFVWFTFFGFDYLFNAGIGLFVGVDLSSQINFLYRFRFPSISLGKSDPDKLILLVNIVPIMIALYIDPIKKAIKN